MVHPSDRRIHGGSVRGWLPFIERYQVEIRKPLPQIEHRGEAKSIVEPPAWEKEHLSLRNTLAGEDKANYLASLRDHTSIGRGYRPPYYLKIREAVNDTELVDLAINLKTNEISFDWRRTFALFFVEQRFTMLAERRSGKQRTYDPDLVAAASRSQASMHMHDSWNSNARRARRKRLQPWVNDNRHRMTPEDRLKAEDNVERTKHQDMEEVVPEKCAEDLPYLLQWPWVHDDVYAAPRKPVQFKCGPRGCSTM